jgi:hypothetical protein
MVLFPLNKHRRDNISARIHPQDQMSTFVVYAAQQQRSSGERYQRVQTYSVICWSASEACSPMLFSSRAIPKSQIRRSQLLLTRRFFGFKSLWMILAEWIYFNPRKIWYKKNTQCEKLNGWQARITV